MGEEKKTMRQYYKMENAGLKLPQEAGKEHDPLDL